MEDREWRDKIINNSKILISNRNNLSLNEVEDMNSIFELYLDDGISIIKKWRKLNDFEEFLSGQHDSALREYIYNRYLASGREIFQSYSSGGVSSSMKTSPDDILKSTCSQRI